MPDTPAPQIKISAIGARGDGIARANGEVHYVPRALPGETWVRDVNGGYRCLAAVADRQAPPCRHFERCGGCIGQHMPGDAYRRWKAGMVQEALAAKAIDQAIDPAAVWCAPLQTRRRVTLGIERRGENIALGFRAARSHELVDIDECPIADDRIVNLLATIRALVGAVVVEGGAMLGAEARAYVLAADNGCDVALTLSHTPADLGAASRRAAAAIAEEGGILRLSIDGEEIFQKAQPVIRIGKGDVDVPGSVFVQAVAEAERAMAQVVVKSVHRAKRVADLFCGVGAFTLPLAERARVDAFDSNSDAVGALAGAVRTTQGLKPVTARRRDLFREPLSRGELRDFDAVVFDPPRSGAPAQAAALARSTVPTVVAVSCNPQTLARDLRLLIDGGYRLDAVHVFDQFLFSAHVEVVAVLRRT